MFRSGWRNHLPLIRTLALMAALMVLIGWGLASLNRNHDRQGLDAGEWQWAPAASFAESEPPSSGWIPFLSEPNLQNESRYYWLRIPLPSQSPRDPRLWIFNAVALKVTDGKRVLFSYDPVQSGQKLNPFTHWNLAPLPTPLPSEVYLLSDNRGAERPAPWLQTVSQGDLYIHLLLKDGYSFVLGALFLFTSFVALGLFFSRRDKLHLYFGLMAFCGFYASLVRNYLFQVYWDQPWFGYMEIAVFPLGVYAFVSIMLEVFPSPRNASLDILRKVILGFTAVTFLGSVFLDPDFFGWLLSYPLILLFLVAAAVIYRVLLAVYRERRGADAVWMLTGFFVTSVSALIHAVSTFLPAVFGRIEEHVPLLERIPFDPLTIGLFLFLICLIRVIVFRFGMMNERLQHIGEFLEQSVRSRTAELEDRTRQLRESSSRLAASTRETAETIASTMLLEERHRITGNIHDTVGHALTATIVQLEAAKRLLDRDPRLAMDKLAASQGLIRRGLEEIRQSVRLLSDDFSSYDLTDAMIGLIRETEQSADARFELRMEPFPESLTPLQKRVLYQALQEGITNALRHGGSTRFLFSINVREPVILFRLESDGITYEPSSFGFGLKAMSERVSQLGGVMSVEPGHPGCVLLLSLPFQERQLQALS